MSKWGVPHGAPDIGPNQASPLSAFWGLVQKRRSSTLHSIIPFLERKKDIPLTPQGIRFFLWPFIIKHHWKKQGCQLTWKERKVNFYKSPKTPPHITLCTKRQITLSPCIPSLIQLFPSSTSNNTFKALEFHIYGA